MIIVRPEIISILCPVRGRPQITEKLCQSLEETKSNIPVIELIIHVDYDDNTLSGYQELEKRYNIKLIRGTRSSLGTLYNRLYKSSTGSIIMLSSDDLIFKTKDWNQIVLEKVTSIPDKIFFISGFHSTNPKMHGHIYFFISKTMIELLNYASPSFLNRHIDSYWNDLALMTNRLVHLPILIDHEHHLQGMREKDQADHELDAKYQTDLSLFNNTKYMRSADAATLMHHINHFNHTR